VAPPPVRSPAADRLPRHLRPGGGGGDHHRLPEGRDHRAPAGGRHGTRAQQPRFRRGAEFGAADGRTYALASADLDGDGDIDLVEAKTAQTNAAHYNEGGGAKFRTVELAGSKADTYGVALGDMNGDGLLDAVFANAGAINEVWLGR